MSDIERYALAALDSWSFTLILWGVLSLFGEPGFVHHHLTEFLLWVGFAYWLAAARGRRDGARGQ